MQRWLQYNKPLFIKGIDYAFNINSYDHGRFCDCLHQLTLIGDTTMNHLNPKIIIFSVSHPTNSAKTNEYNTRNTWTLLAERGIEYKRLWGRFAGIVEESILVSAEHERLVCDLCTNYNQECYLVSESDRYSYLRYPSEDNNLGYLRAQKTAPNGDYTYDPSTKLYWVISDK